MYNNLELVASEQLVSPAPSILPALIKDENVAPEVVVKDPPTPTLPTRSDIPVTLRVFNIELDVTVREVPTPTLPEVTSDPPIPILPKLPVPVI